MPRARIAWLLSLAPLVARALRAALVEVARPGPELEVDGAVVHSALRAAGMAMPAPRREIRILQEPPDKARGTS